MSDTRDIPLVNTAVPAVARVYDCLLGGKDNFEADRQVAERIMVVLPSAPVVVRAQRAFLARAVHYLVTEAGIRQFLDIGTGMPAAVNTHEMAQRAAPESRVVYVDNDPVVLSHARARLTSAPRGATGYLEADLRDVGKIMHEAASVLDLRKPVAVLLLGVLACCPDSDDPAAIVARLMGAVPPGSYLAVAHPASDVAESMQAAIGEYNQLAARPLTARSHGQVLAFFKGLDLIDPGLVQLHRWRPGAGELGGRLALPNYGGVARTRNAAGWLAAGRRPERRSSHGRSGSCRRQRRGGMARWWSFTRGRG